jgi:hypothetical protein
MEKNRQTIKQLVAVMLMLPIVMGLTWAMGQRPPARRTALGEGQGKAAVSISPKEKLASMEGVTKRKIDLLETGMGGWESEVYNQYVKMMRNMGSKVKVLMYLVEEKDVRVGLDSSFAVVVESRYYLITEEGRDESGCLGIYFIDGELYVIDALQQVLWRKTYDCGDEPMYGQDLQIRSFGDRHFVIEIPDREMMEQEYIYKQVLFNYEGKVLRVFLSENFRELTERGKYLYLSFSDDDKRIVYNLFSKDSVVVYGALLEIDDYDQLIIDPFNGPRQKYLYNQVRGKVIDVRKKR